VPVLPLQAAPVLAVAPRRGGLPVDLTRGGLLLALGAMLMLKVATGAILYYIKPDLAWLVLVAAAGLLVVGGAYLLRWAVVRPPAVGWRATLAEGALLVPLVAGLALPARPLDSASLAGRGLNTYAALPSADARLAALQSDTHQWTLLDWSLALQREADPTRLRGQPVSLVGFVYTGDRALQPGEFSLVRFVVTCCTADGAAVGLPVRHETAGSLARDTWVRVEGTLEVAAVEGQAPRAVVAAASVQPVDVPRQPYLYP
jgi:uncharacterized repeat protein (TIGR03943 family)